MSETTSRHTPSRIIPHRGQRLKDCSESSRGEHGAVFGKNKRRLNLADNARHLVPEPGFCFGDADALAARRDILARETSADAELAPDGSQPADVGGALGIVSPERGDVVPDREDRQAEISLSLK